MTDTAPPNPVPEPRVRVIVYDPATGRIDHVNSAVPESLAASQAGPGQAVLVTDDPVIGGAGWWIVEETLVRRPVLSFDRLEIAADGVEVASLDLPGAFVAEVDGVAVAAEDRLEIASDMPGSYRVVIERFPYLSYEAEIVAA